MALDQVTASKVQFEESNALWGKMCNLKSFEQEKLYIIGLESQVKILRNWLAKARVNLRHQERTPEFVKSTTKATTTQVKAFKIMLANLECDNQKMTKHIDQLRQEKATNHQDSHQNLSCL